MASRDTSLSSFFSPHVPQEQEWLSLASTPSPTECITSNAPLESDGSKRQDVTTHIDDIDTHEDIDDSYWLPSAARAAEALEKGLWRLSHRSANEFLVSVAANAGYQVSSFRRQVRSANFLRQKLGDRFEAIIKTKRPPVSAIELISRLHEVNAQKANSLLESVLSGSITFIRVREIYTQELKSELGVPLRSSVRSSSKSRSYEVREIAKARVLNHLPMMFGENEAPSIALREPRYPEASLRFAKVDFVLTGQDSTGSAFAEAFECRTIGGDSRRAIVIPMLQECHWLSLHFRRVWLTFPMTASQTEDMRLILDELIEAIEVLKLNSIGIILCKDHSPSRRGDPSLIIKRMAVASPCKSDAQALMLESLGVLAHANDQGDNEEESLTERPRGG